MATDADLDMADLASLDAPASSAARFHPKVRGKAKAKLKPKTKPKRKSGPEGGVDAMETDRVSAGESADLEDEDFVVREMDVYFTPKPFDKDTKLYIAQYPLRPCWRPYELGEVCKEVRVRPESSEVEVDLEIDTESDNYDPETVRRKTF
ncbi:hypothetical protein TRIUR3_27365 [Triticum urartu]|uniref:DNA-directed RNA polymerase III subunit RPC5 n=1 Tax=Triticum urartu TaxID=4572 RepID=M7ZU68_TRIUA|nr:hypothetical protein TRIUR3_27365 [Triticum urartu]